MQTKADEAPTINFNPIIDTGFQLGPLPQLGFGFYGRRKEYRQLRDALLVNNHRAAIIHGIGGIGKTSLSAHAADRLYKRRQRFNGVYAFDCAGGTLAPERMLLELHRYFSLQGISALGQFLHQSLEPETMAQIVAQVLTQWPLLLIFDNFETQLERVNDGFRIADEQARRFLAALVKTTSQGTKFLFTSRFVFDLDERLGDVASIPLGDLSRPEAFSVMLKLPRLAKASYTEKGTIYDTFGGHPFALVALDKYCQTVPIDKALQNAKAIHTKLREHLALELNYGQLTGPARELLNRLAAFRVAVPMEAAEWVMGEEVTPPPEALQAMVAMIRQDENFPAELKDADDTTLLQMLTVSLPTRRQPPNDLQQSVRELMEWELLTPHYSDEVLQELSVHSVIRELCRDNQSDIWPNRLCDAASFYTNLTRLSAKAEKTVDMVWNEMKALELLIEAEDYSAAAEILSINTEMLDRWGYGRYIESQYLRVIEYVEREDAVVLMQNLGILLQARGNYDAALDYYQRALRLSEELANRSGVANALQQIGTVLQERGDYAAALDYYERALQLSEELANKSGVANALQQIGTVLQERGDYAAALDYYERSLSINKQLGNLSVVANSMHNIGSVQQARGNYDVALDYYQRALMFAERLGNVSDLASSLLNIGTVQQARGNHDAALDHYQRALKLAEDLGNHWC